MNSQEVTSKDEITGHQRKQLIVLVTNTLDTMKQNVESIIDELKLNTTEAQEIIEGQKFIQGQLKASVKEIMLKNAIIDARFGPPIVEFDFTVPTNYNHDTQIDDSRKNAKKEKTTNYYDDNLTSMNFANATNKLEPGKKYIVKIFPIITEADSVSCLIFLRRQNAILVGGQGATLVYDLAKEQLPKGKWTVSFDEKNALWEDSDGNHKVPCVQACSDGDFEFDVEPLFEFEWDPVHCLLCICDKKSS